MLRNLIAGAPSGGIILEWIEFAALAIEALAVAIIVVAIFYATARYTFLIVFNRGYKEQYYGQLKVSLGKALLLGLEILVAPSCLDDARFG